MSRRGVYSDMEGLQLSWSDLGRSAPANGKGGNEDHKMRSIYMYRKTNRPFGIARSFSFRHIGFTGRPVSKFS